MTNRLIWFGTIPDFICLSTFSIDFVSQLYIKLYFMADTCNWRDYALCHPVLGQLKQSEMKITHRVA